jgi:hypothetical protein
LQDAVLTSRLPRTIYLCGDDLAYEGDGGGRDGRDLQRLEEHLSGFVEQRGILGEERRERLADTDAVAELGMHLDARVRADRSAGMGAASSQALHGPADLLAVHYGEEARAAGSEGAGCGGAVEGGGVGEGGKVWGFVARG